MRVKFIKNIFDFDLIIPQKQYFVNFSAIYFVVRGVV